jgi:hypothetical protein
VAHSPINGIPEIYQAQGSTFVQEQQLLIP